MGDIMIITDTEYGLENEIVINNIEELNSIDVIPDIINLTHIDNKKDFKILLNYLKKLKGKILIINDKDKYLKRIFYRYLDIYRYGNNIYDDIEYIKKDKIIFKYDSNKYEINNTNDSILGLILIKLILKNNIEEIINSLEKTS